MKEKLLVDLRHEGLVAVVRAETSAEALRICDACAEGGIRFIELTFTVPGAHRILGELNAKFADKDFYVGAGTVLDPETSRIAILEGASFVVSPAFSPESARLCNRYRVPYMPGVGTISEIITALEAGVDVLKVFPGETYGPGFIKAVRGPLPHALLMPTGGVSLANVGEWLAAGAIALGVGSQLTAPAKKGDWAGLTALAKEFVAAVAKARKP